jgi:chloramphenicol 3-O-phosphotransferase
MLGINVLYLHCSIDEFILRFPISHIESTEQAKLIQDVLPVAIHGFHQSVAATVKAGINVIIDTVLCNESVGLDFMRVFESIDVVLIGVKCDLDIVNAREQKRGDREIGTARMQYDSVHGFGPYDLEVDTGIHDSSYCAELVKELLVSGNGNPAFQAWKNQHTSKW